MSTVLANSELLHHEIDVLVIVPHGGFLHVERLHQLIQPLGGTVRVPNVPAVAAVLEHGSIQNILTKILLV